MKIALTQTERKSYTDAVIDGLLSGLAAGLAMLAYLLVTGLIDGNSLLSVINLFYPAGQDIRPLASVLLHLGVSSIYGVLYGLILRSVLSRVAARVPAWLLGMVYGLLLYLLAHYLLLPGSGSALQQLPPWQFASAHLLYGAVLGILFARE